MKIRSTLINILKSLYMTLIITMVSTLTMIIIVSSVLNGCVEAPPYYYAEVIKGKEFIPFHDQVGIYPNISVINDPNNPFRGHSIGSETRWMIESDGDPVAGFYSWATLLASIPTGEHQFYTALNLKSIYQQEQTQEMYLDQVRLLAIQGFQAVLDYFPNAVTYDQTGKIPYGLATLAYQNIIDLDGVPQGGWTLVATPEGNQVAIQIIDFPPPLDEMEMP